MAPQVHRKARAVALDQQSDFLLTPPDLREVPRAEADRPENSLTRVVRGLLVAKLPE